MAAGVAVADLVEVMERFQLKTYPPIKFDVGMKALLDEHTCLAVSHCNLPSQLTKCLAPRRTDGLLL